MSNILELTKNIEVPERFEIKASEIGQLLQLSQGGTDGQYEAIIAAFKYGYEMGTRAAIYKNMAHKEPTHK